MNVKKISILFIVILGMHPFMDAYPLEKVNDTKVRVKRCGPLCGGAVSVSVVARTVSLKLLELALMSSVFYGVSVAAENYKSDKQLENARTIIAEQREFESEQKMLKYRKIDCTTANYGCFEGSCYRSCGPRIAASDFCFVEPGKVQTTINIDTSSNGTHQISYEDDLDPNYVKPFQPLNVTSKINIIQTEDGMRIFAKCSRKDECNPCWECAEPCRMS